MFGLVCIDKEGEFEKNILCSGIYDNCNINKWINTDLRTYYSNDYRKVYTFYLALLKSLCSVSAFRRQISMVMDVISDYKTSCILLRETFQ